MRTLFIRKKEADVDLRYRLTDFLPRPGVGNGEFTESRLMLYKNIDQYAVLAKRSKIGTTTSLHSIYYARFYTSYYLLRDAAEISNDVLCINGARKLRQFFDDNNRRLCSPDLVLHHNGKLRIVDVKAKFVDSKAVREKYKANDQLYSIHVLYGGSFARDLKRELPGMLTDKQLKYMRDNYRVFLVECQHWHSCITLDGIKEMIIPAPIYKEKNAFGHALIHTVEKITDVIVRRVQIYNEKKTDADVKAASTQA